MLKQIIIAAVLICGCIVVQSAMMASAFVYLRKWQTRYAPPPTIMRASMIVGGMTLWLMVVHAVSIGAWAILYHALGVFADWDTSVYFSAVTFTTLGFGDVIPPEEWRQLAGLCAAHGLLLFGVSSAALVEAFRWSFEGD